MPDSTIEITFEFTRDDKWQFVKFLQLRTWPSRLNLVGACLIIPSVAFALAWIGSFPLAIMITFVATISVVSVPLYLWAWKKHVKSTPSDKGNELGRRVFAVTPDGVRETTRYTQEYCLWKGVLDIAETRDHIFIFIDQHKAYVVPKSAFGHPDEVRTFVNTIASYWRHAGNTDQPESLLSELSGRA